MSGQNLGIVKLQHMLKNVVPDMMEKAARILVEQGEELERYRRNDEASKLAAAMEEKNLSLPGVTSKEEAIQHIASLPPEKVAAMRLSVEMATPQDPFAHLDGEQTNNEGGYVPGHSPLEQFIVGNLD